MTTTARGVGRFFRRAPRLTLDQWLDEWLAQMAIGRPRTCPFYRLKLVHIRPLLGAISLTALDSRNVRLALLELSTNLSGTMLHHIYRTLSAALNAAVKEGHIERNPCVGITAPKRSEFEARTLTTEQAQRLVAVSRDTRMGPLVIVALSTGMRAGELLALTWEDIDLAAGTVRVNKSVKWLPHGAHQVGSPKTRSGRRTVRIDGPAVQALKAQRQRVSRMRLQAAKWTDLDLVFPSVRGFYWVPQGRFVRDFRLLLSKAGCPQIRFHDLRHTAGLFLTRSVGVVVASRMLGHSSPAVTVSLYGHAQAEDFSAAARAMGDLLTSSR